MTQEKVNQGKRNRAAGKRFEDKTRKDLESKGFVVDRWTNNVFFIDHVNDEGSIKMFNLGPAKPKIRMAKLQFGFGPILMNAYTGFPDFVCYNSEHNDVQGVECKVNGKLDKEEKEKCDWLLENNIFSKILIASKNGKEVVYTEWKKQKKNLQKTLTK